MRKVLSWQLFPHVASCSREVPFTEPCKMTPCVDKGRAPLDSSSYQPPRPAASFFRPMAEMDFFFSPACIADQCALPVFNGGAALPPFANANINVKRNNSTQLEPCRERGVCWLMLSDTLSDKKNPLENISNAVKISRRFPEQQNVSGKHLLTQKASCCSLWVWIFHFIFLNV